MTAVLNATESQESPMSAVLTVTEAAEARRSIRQYEQAPIPEADLREIIRVAGRAPSAWNLQPWRVTVVREPALKEQLKAAAYGQPQVGNAPAVLVIWSDMGDTVARIETTVHPGMQGEQREKHIASVAGTFNAMSEADREAWGSGQAYIFAGFLALAAKAHGYDTSFMLGFKPEEVKQLLGIPAHARIPALVAIGKGTEPGFPTFRHELERFVTWR